MNDIHTLVIRSSDGDVSAWTFDIESEFQKAREYAAANDIEILTEHPSDFINDFQEFKSYCECKGEF